jgi:hypothetical protein
MVIAVLSLMLWVGIAAAQEEEDIVLRYRIELLDKGEWKPVKSNKTFKKGQEIRLRCLPNAAGSLYLLNASAPWVSPEPIFKEGTGVGLKRYLGLATPVESNHVGLVPNPAEGGSLRFSGVKGYERFLLVFVADHLSEGTRAMQAIPIGAEGWDFEDKTSYTVRGNADYMFFHYFELKSK